MPCVELFEEQSVDYKYSIFPEGVPVLAVEAQGSFGWPKWSHAQHCMETFGASGPVKVKTCGCILSLPLSLPLSLSLPNSFANLNSCPFSLRVR